MPSEKLINAPLLEAVLEIRWKLKEIAQGVYIDPNYKILLGRMYDRCLNEYPFHETLPTASMPDEMLPYTVQHRFRKANGNWPLIQLGPGIITLNDTKNYEWENFCQRGKTLCEWFYESYPNAKNDVAISSIQLHYIDGIKFNYLENDPSEFISKNLRVTLALPDELFTNTPINKTPSGLNAFFVFPINTPARNLNLRITTGEIENEKAIIWETIVQTETAGVPEMPNMFTEWLRAAHEITHGLFFKMIEGPLMERFK